MQNFEQWKPVGRWDICDEDNFMHQVVRGLFVDERRECAQTMTPKAVGRS